MSEESCSAFQTLTRIAGDFLAEHHEIEREGFVVAFSGGLDSSCLLDLLVARGLRPARVIHVDHGLRDEAELRAERIKVERFCAERRLGLTVATIRRGRIVEAATQGGVGIEAAARELRYKALVAQARRWRAGWILTAHHEDDVLETLLYRSMRSAGTAGLGGIAPVRKLSGSISVARPLLKASRALLAAYAAERGLDYSVDSSNDVDEFERNRLRHRLIPVLDSEFPQWRRGWIGTAAAARAEAEALAAALRLLARPLGAGKAGADQAVFDEAPGPLRERLVGALLVESGSRAKFSRSALAAAAKALGNGAEAIDLYDRRFRFSSGNLLCEPRLDFGAERGYFFLIPSEGRYVVDGVTVDAWWEERPAAVSPPDPGLFPSSSAGAWLAEDSFSFPLALRTRRPGDGFRNAAGTTKVDDALKTWKLDARGRRFLPIAEDREGIVALLPRACEGFDGYEDRHRTYHGPLGGRRFFIRIKGV